MKGNGASIRLMPAAPRRRPATTRRAPAGIEPHVAAVRRFTRFFTSVIGVLEEGYLESPFTVTEARILYELATRAEVSAVDLVRDLGLDAGYVSRLLTDFDPAAAPGSGIDDPWYGPGAGFERTLDSIEAAIPGLLDHVAGLVPDQAGQHP